jgi:hypothetical protein
VGFRGIKVEQQRNTKQKNVQNDSRELLLRLIGKGVLELKPNLDYMGIHYPEVEEIWKNADPIHIKNTLQRLEKEGAIKSRLSDRSLICPNCDSSELHSKYACLNCSSPNVKRTELLEHMKCGYMSTRSNFTKGESLICPGCRVQLTKKPMEYRAIGRCYQCKECGYRFDKPENTQSCQKCGRIFTREEAKYAQILTYEITEETVNALGRGLPILRHIENILIKRGFKVQLHPQITGPSGAQHQFDVLAEKRGIRLVIDISITGNKDDMISLLKKKLDVNPTRAVIIDLSNLNQLTQLENAYDILVFKAINYHSLPEDFTSFLEVLDSTEMIDWTEKSILESAKLRIRKINLESETKIIDEKLVNELTEQLQAMGKEERDLTRRIRALEATLKAKDLKKKIKVKSEVIKQLQIKVSELQEKLNSSETVSIKEQIHHPLLQGEGPIKLLDLGKKKRSE